VGSAAENDGLPATDDAVGTVAHFYALVSSRQFEGAESLWSARMRTRYPPRQNIVERFSNTTTIGLQRAAVVAQTETTATVDVDVAEVDARGLTRHFVGQWHLVRAGESWLLDQPELQSSS
jgi:hypothetical protein